MLSITFGYSKYYVNALSENVRRGFRTKAENGWRPAAAPIGYLNDPQTHTIVLDPDRFALVRRLWDLMLTGAYTPSRLCTIAASEWGLRTKQRRRIGGAPLSVSGVYRVLTNPFYAGVLEWGGKTYPGKHEAMITLDQFDRVQALLGRPSRPRRKTHDFAYTGLIRCGECGYAVTAEHKVNRWGSRYTYYHCTKRRLDYRCRQPVIQADDLEREMLRFLETITLPGRFFRYAPARLEREAQRRDTLRDVQRRTLAESHARVEQQLANLTKLRVRDLLSDEDFVRERQILERERLRLAQALDGLDRATGWFEPNPP